MKRPLIILDAGHGNNTPGKRSPIWADRTQLFEWEFNRDIVRRIAEQLDALDIAYTILVPEDEDISLGERCRRANKIYDESGNNAYLLSIHANAGGGTGWECFTSVGQTKSDKIANVLCQQAKTILKQWRMRFDDSDGDLDKEAPFYILRKTSCPAVLTENFFMDTEKDCRFIMSEQGRAAVTKVHIEAIKQLENI